MASAAVGAERFPAAYCHFVELFNREEFWESHEVLEGPWRRNGSHFYQGLIIYASVFVHVQRGNPRGVRKQMAKVERYLKPFTPHYMGIDVDAVLAHGRHCVQLLDQHPEWSGDRLASSMPRIRLRLDARLVRGDEPEMEEADESLH